MTPLRRLLVATLPALLAASGDEADAHELPVVTGIDGAESGNFVLRTTRGFVVYDREFANFRLQCLEYSGLSTSETPAFATDGATTAVATTSGLLSFDNRGCGASRSPVPGAMAVADVRYNSRRGWLAVTSAAGATNDAYTSADGSTWTPQGLDLDGRFLFSLVWYGDGMLGTGVRIDTESGQPVFFVATWSENVMREEVQLDVGASTHRVLIEDVGHAADRVLVLVDRLASSGESDELLEVGSPGGGALHTARRGTTPNINAARFGAPGVVWAATDQGLVRFGGGSDIETTDAGTRFGALASNESDTVWISTDYSVEGCALGARNAGGDIVPWLRYEQIAGPTECDDAPDVCGADWVDWSAEIEVSDVPAPTYTEFTARLSGDAESRDESGCAQSAATCRPPLWTLLPLLCLVASRRSPTRRLTRWLTED